VCAYWKTNLGQAWALKFWENHLKKESEHLHVQEIVELCQSFRENRTHHRDHMRQLLNSHLKPVILSKWADEVEYNQRVLFNLMQEMDHLEYYDEQIWQHCF
jgi:hypothetical protein